MDIEKIASWEEIHKMAKAARDEAEAAAVEVEKGRIYLKPGEKPPKGVSVRRGVRGGMFYEGVKTPVVEKPTAEKPKVTKPSEKWRGMSGDDRRGYMKRLQHAGELKDSSIAQSDDEDDRRYAATLMYDDNDDAIVMFAKDSNPDTREIVASASNGKHAKLFVNDSNEYVRHRAVLSASMSDLPAFAKDPSSFIRTTVRERLTEAKLRRQHKKIPESIKQPSMSE